MILAAGRGERLRPLTDQTPKPLLRAGGRSLIEHLIGGLVASGFRELVINVCHLGALIEAHLGDGRRLGARIVYSPEGPEPLETAGGIRHALPLLGEEPFLVVNGDIATDFPFDRLKGLPVRQAHLVLIPNPSHHLQGDFSLEDGRIAATGRDRYTFAGIGVYHPSLFSRLAPGRAPLTPLLRQVLPQGGVTGELYRGFWMDIGTVERLRALDQRLGSSEPMTVSLDQNA